MPMADDIITLSASDGGHAQLSWSSIGQFYSSGDLEKLHDSPAPVGAAQGLCCLLTEGAFLPAAAAGELPSGGEGEKRLLIPTGRNCALCRLSKWAKGTFPPLGEQAKALCWLGISLGTAWGGLRVIGTPLERSADGSCCPTPHPIYAPA